MVSVVLPCYNAASTIAEQMEALASQRCSEPWELIVVDNRSTDDSMAIVARFAEAIPGLRIVDASERQGRSYARNIGVAAARGASIAFCDSDDVVGAGWLSAIADALKRFDCVACRVDFDRINSASSLASNHARHAQHNGLQIAWYAPFLPHAGGGTLGIKRALHQRIGGFDETFATLEDTDYCFRVHLAGGRMQFVPEALVHVRVRPTAVGRFHQVCQWARYNVLLAHRYGHASAPGVSPWKEYVKQWIRLGETLPKVRSRVEWEGWVWHCGWQIGVLQGVMARWGAPLPLPFFPETGTARQGYRPQPPPLKPSFGRQWRSEHSRLRSKR